MQLIFGSIKMRIVGALLIAVDVFALTTPLIAERWSLTILALRLIDLGIAEACSPFASRGRVIDLGQFAISADR